MNFQKVYGWDNEIVNRIGFICKNTRESMKHLIIGMRVTTGVFEDRFIQVMDRRGQTSFIIARSRVFDDKEEMWEAYDRLLHHFDLPHCCDMHRKELHPNEDEDLNGFFVPDELDDLFSDGSDDFDSLFEDGSDDLDSLFEDTDPEDDFDALFE